MREGLGESLRLFNTIPTDTKYTEIKYPDNLRYDILEVLIENGVILSNTAVAFLSNLRAEDQQYYADIIINNLGLSKEQMNASFHKSWDKVKNAPMSQLVAEQLNHYITTYGFKSLGIEDQNLWYVPNEILNIPELTKQVKLKVVKAYSVSELKEKIIELGSKGVALGDETLKDVVNLIKFLNITIKDRIEEIKNKELKVALCYKLGIKPDSPEDLLRMLVYITTGETLLIKNKEMYDNINNGMADKKTEIEVNNILKELGNQQLLSRIFYRYKPIFLSFKNSENLASSVLEYKYGINDKTNKSQINQYINRIRKLAKVHHKPKKKSLTESLTEKVKRGEQVDLTQLERELERLNIFQRIRLLQSLQFYKVDNNGILYHIRNGKSYVTEKQNVNNPYSLETIIYKVEQSIIKQLEKNVKDKTIYIPEYIDYGVPTSEKQFIGEFPYGTTIKLKSDMIVGVHWKKSNADLDLSSLDMQGKIGWDSAYRRNDILFSGDMTRAPEPHGASELFYIKNTCSNKLFRLHNYNRTGVVPFTLYIGQEKVDKSSFEHNYTIDPNKVILRVNNTVEQEKNIGMFLDNSEDVFIRFCLMEANIDKRISGKTDEKSLLTKDYYEHYYRNTVGLNHLLTRAGAIIANGDDEDFDIDLSPEVLEKDTLLNLLT